jgi:3'-phosphoadenosine 5'-phosphosulfate sulfotransferase (PAPS reductase)/FAD synthetase
MAKRRLIEIISEYGEKNCIVAFAGEKISAVMSHLILSLGYNLDHIYLKSTLDYPDCIDFSRNWCTKNDIKLVWVTPDDSPIDIWKTYGYPMFSREISIILEQIRNNTTISPKKLMKVKEFLKYKNIKISAKCCYYLKKKPFIKWQKNNEGKVVIFGDRVTINFGNRMAWIRNGCNYKTNGQIISKPFSFFTDKDICRYINDYKLTLPAKYTDGFENNGCFCCGFGCHLLEKNKFVKLKKINHELWKIVMDEWGFRKICQQCNVNII